MHQSGTRNEQNGIEAVGLSGIGKVFWNLAEAPLYERSIARGETKLTATGALAAETGPHTGRSPADRFIVRDEATEESIWWDNANALSREHFEALKADFIAHAGTRTLFAQDLDAGADPANRVGVRVYTEHAWHALFIRTMLREPAREALTSFKPQLTVICVPSFRADPEKHGVRSSTVIACDFSAGLVLIGGTLYAGEMKKSVFSYLNYILPERGVLPMHCSANAGTEGDVALFFGLSGTGKTTLSADPTRALIGDDEHGWSKDGVFNIEGGCYAKTIRLSAQAEPAIYAATQRFGTVLENVVLDGDSRLPDFDDASLAENARAAYPLDFIAGARTDGRGGVPKTIIMLTCDAFGIMPPVAKLSSAQAMYHFLSGYTAKVAGTEAGLAEPQATFSACFGAPFMPRHPAVYGRLLRDLVAEHGVDCWLVNTGWTGGKAGTGQRMPIEVTRRLVSAALDGNLRDVETRTDPHFGFAVPTKVEGVDPRLLDPARNWASRMDYAMTARRLVSMFSENFARFDGAVDDEVRHAQPGMAIAAE